MDVTFVPYKIISCSSENPVHPSSGIYQIFNEDSLFWETNTDTLKAELVLGFSSPSSIRTIVVG